MVLGSTAVLVVVELVVVIDGSCRRGYVVGAGTSITSRLGGPSSVCSVVLNITR